MDNNKQSVYKRLGDIWAGNMEQHFGKFTDEYLSTPTDRPYKRWQVFDKYFPPSFNESVCDLVEFYKARDKHKERMKNLVLEIKYRNYVSPYNTVCLPKHLPKHLPQQPPPRRPQHLPRRQPKYLQRQRPRNLPRRYLINK